MDSELQTTHLRVLVDRLQRGEPGALDELLRRTSRRMEQLARAMLRRYPAVRAHEQTADVVQEATLSLLVALRQLKFASTREFYGLATEHLRRRLIDLAKRYANPDRSPAALPEGGTEDVASDESDLGRWQALHEAVELLPADCREVFSLRFYHGWAVDQVAELMQTSSRTVARQWSRAVLGLHARLGEGGMPGDLTGGQD